MSGERAKFSFSEFKSDCHSYLKGVKSEKKINLLAVDNYLKIFG